MTLQCLILFITVVSQRGNGLFKAMEQTSYNIVEGLPDLVEHSRKLLGLSSLYYVAWKEGFQKI